MSAVTLGGVCAFVFYKLHQSGGLTITLLPGAGWLDPLICGKVIVLEGAKQQHLPDHFRMFLLKEVWNSQANLSFFTWAL